jgi:hypothetical protein
MTVREALEKLNDLIDESDPDANFPNMIHAFQTAERARKEYPEHDWLHLTGLIHDMGKVMAFYGKSYEKLRVGFTNSLFYVSRCASMGCCWRHICRWM